MLKWVLSFWAAFYLKDGEHSSCLDQLPPETISNYVFASNFYSRKEKGLEASSCEKIYSVIYVDGESCNTLHTRFNNWFSYSDDTFPFVADQAHSVGLDFHFTQNLHNSLFHPRSEINLKNCHLEVFTVQM